MKKSPVLSLIILTVLTGCAATSSGQKEQVSQSTFESREEMLSKTGNPAQLIQLYKNRLKESDSQEIRLKLIEAYLEEKDYESAAFYLDKLQEKPQASEQHGQLDGSLQAKIDLLQARVLFVQGKPEKASEFALRAIEKESNYPEAENLMGLIRADLGDLAKAREYFNLARQHYYDDSVVKNNLAMLDLIEEDYQAAADKLQPLYQKGLTDEKITANLVLAYAKLGNYPAVEGILKKQDYTAEEIQSVFIGLKVSDNVVANRLHLGKAPKQKREAKPKQQNVSEIKSKSSGLSESEDKLALMLEDYIQQEADKGPEKSGSRSEEEANNIGAVDEDKPAN